ncbi:methionine biosynthesis protein MetW [Methylobacterium komagatae]
MSGGTPKARPWEAAEELPREGAGARVDHLVVLDLVPAGARVLDIGCGDGALLALLRDRRGIDGRGIELSREGVNACLARGLPVIQGDADTDLANYPDGAFDVVVMSQTIQATRQPREVLEHLLRIGRHVIISFPNFGHWRVRTELALRGRMPVTDLMPDAWYETANIHHCTIRDFVGLCRVLGARIETAAALDSRGRAMRFALPWWVWNLFGAQGVFLLSKEGRDGADESPFRLGGSLPAKR